MVLPLISIIIPTYNRAALVPETVQSILAQTYSNWEVLMIDDGSDEQTLQLLFSYEKKDSRISIIKRNRQPKGAQTCRNIGLYEAKGSFVIFMDSDDVFENFCFVQRVAFMQKNSSLDFAIFPGLIFNTKKYDRNILISTARDKDIIPGLLTLTPPCVPGNIIWKRESLLTKNILWDEKITAFQDVDFHLLAAYNHLCFNYSNDAPDYFWRKHNLGNTGSELSREAQLASHQYFFKKHVQLLTEQNLYTRYEEQIDRLAGQLLLLAFKAKRKENALSMIRFLQSFQKSFSHINANVLLPLAKLYTHNTFSAAFARACMFIRYPNIFPVFKNKTFARIKWKGAHKF